MSTIGSEPNRDPRTDCDELRDLLPAFAIGTTTAEETARVRELIPLCPEAAGELADYGALSGSLVESVEALLPPPRLKANLMARLAEKEGLSPAFTDASSSAPVPISRRTMPEPIRSTRSREYRMTTNRSRGSWLLAAAAVILLAATNLYWFSQSRIRDAELQSAQDELARSRVRQEDALTLMSNLQTQRIGLQSTDEGLIPLATIYWDPNTNEAALVTDQLPPLEDQQTYQLWLINDAGPQSAGTFDLDANGFGWLVFDPGATLTNFDALGISVEPEGGSEAPTTTPVAVGQVSV
jgi:hypothetical protein